MFLFLVFPRISSVEKCLLYFAMNTVVFAEIVNTLQGINYFFISGLSVAIHTSGQRIPGDIDIAVHPSDIDTLATRLGTIAKRRVINKGTFTVDDYGFEVEYKGQMIECTSGYPAKRIQEKTFNKLFERKVKTTYLEQTVYVEPLEELVNQKAFMHREKDLKDLELLKGRDLDSVLLLEISHDKGNTDIVIPLLRNYFDIIK